MKAILWVDDDPDINVVHLEELASYGYTVTIAKDPEEMWAALHETPDRFSGIIMDVLMPTGETVDAAQAEGGLKTGLILIAELKKLAQYRKIPIILFTIVHAGYVASAGQKYGIPVLRKQATTPAALAAAVRRHFG